ncbi:hypothetical protein CPB84DRAFT_1753315 [Gymnopilus junonius]|uniref:Uncharacterized protein n=1 Tax=Gymnopilus junonius TaxID=109634 RepID=A0A9P5TGG1_GYMJU|nr:hypothetical protein CPB84DRAFT_1753315 [Gymnopilus junonius]
MSSTSANEDHVSAETLPPSQGLASNPDASEASASGNVPSALSTPAQQQAANTQLAPANANGNGPAQGAAQAPPPYGPARQQNALNVPAPNVALPQGTIMPRDYFQHLVSTWIPLAGFSRITHLSDYVYGIVDANGTIHAIHTMQLKMYLSFTYRCLGQATPHPLYYPLGYMDFTCLINSDPAQVSCIMVLNDDGLVMAPPTAANFPLVVDFPPDDHVCEALCALDSLGGTACNVHSINGILIPRIGLNVAAQPNMGTYTSTSETTLMLSGKDVFAISPTGSGKMLMFWILLLFITKGITIIITALSPQHPWR